LRIRHLVSLAVIAIGATTFLWYAALAPARGNSIQPGYQELIATAAVSGSGSWVRYIITVNNVGSLDFEGDALLVDRLDPGLISGRVSSLPTLYSSPIWGAPIGQARFTAAAPDAAYQVHIRVPSHQRRVVPIVAPEGYTAAEILNYKGQPIEIAPVENAGGIAVAFLGDEETAATIQAIRFDDLGVKVTDYTGPDLLPTSALGLAGFAEVIIGHFRTDLMSQAQLVALRDYVGFGGSLILAGGGFWRTSLLPLPPDLLPMRPNSSVEGSIQPISAVAGRSDDALLPVQTGDIRTGARVAVAAAGGPPLIVESSYGSGRIVQLAFDPGAEQLRPARIGNLAWTEAIARGLDKAPGMLPGSRLIPGPVPAETSLFPPYLDGPPVSALLVGIGFLVYLMVVGPGIYLALRRRGRPELMLVAVPLIAFVTAGSIYAAGSMLRGGTRVNEIHILKVAPGGAVADLTYTRVYFHQRGDHRMDLQEGSLMAPMTLDVSLHTQAGCDVCVLQFAGETHTATEHAVLGRRPQVHERGVAYGTARVVASVSSSHQPMGVEAHLTSTAKQVGGTITNRGSSTIRSAALYVFDEDGYQRVALADEIPPGATVNVHGEPAPGLGRELPVSGANARAGTGDPVAAAVAHAALLQDPRPVLIGFVDLPPPRIRVDGAIPSRTGVALLEQQVRLEQTDRPTWSTTSKRLVALSGDVRGGFLSTYDLQMPPVGAAPVVLGTEAPGYSTMEIYDWSTASWGPSPWQADPNIGARHQTQLSPDQVHDGLVRLRVRETHPSWGATVTLSVAA
jgi:hypothetical protein